MRRPCDTRRAARVFFASAATAVAAGYRPCAVCLPADYASWRGLRSGEVPAG
ncbi:MAG: Ada metal-binding domain-containing protein [Mycobacteriales bacterium]